MNTDLTNAVAAVGKAGELLNIVAKGTIDTLPWDHALELLADLRATMDQHLRPIESSLVRHVYLTGPHGTTEVEGHGIVEIRRTPDRKRWDERSAVYAALDTFMARRDGEVPDPADVVDMVLELVGVQYLRTTALRAYGLRPGDFCEETPGKPSVRIGG